MINKPNDFDVLIVGAGPSGLTLANILANLNISVGIFDKKASTVKEPRAVSIDDESLRIIQSFGLHNLLRKNIAENYGSHYFDGKGKLFLKVEPKSFENGFFKRNAFDQPFFENLLRENLKGNRFAKIKLWSDPHRITPIDIVSIASESLLSSFSCSFKSSNLFCWWYY